MSDQKIETLQQAVLELERRKREDPLKYVYAPHQFQQQIHKSRAPLTLVLGGNRTGKSYSAVAEAILYCLGRSTYAETPSPPNLVWYVVPTSSTFQDAVEPIIEQLMPWDQIVKHDKKYNRYKFKNGSVLAIKSSDQRQKRLVGANVDFVVADEPMPKVVYEELIARLISTSGRMLKVLTPVSEKIDEWLWVRDELYIPWEIGERSDVDVIFMPSVDRDGNPAVPHLSKAQIAQMEQQYPDPETRAARMYGQFIVRGGLVFAGFDKEVNLIPRFPIPDHWQRWMICDPQYHRFAVLYFAADEDGNYYVTDEYFSTDEPMAVRAERILAIAGKHDRAIPMYVDYANPQDIQELNYHFNRLRGDIGAVQLPMQKQVEKMVLRVHAMLEPSPDRHYHKATGQGDIYGAPRLILFDDLASTWSHEGRTLNGSRLIWELQRLTWGKQNKPEKKTAGGGDCTDCLIYGCSIQATGRPAPMTESWKDNLPERDVILWEAIDRQDRQQAKGLQRPR
jgi:phage terminase large subunit-like protein